MLKKVDEIALRKMSIYELRSTARDFGVKSPTTLKRSEMIEQVLEIASGRKEPYKQLDARGRPPKKFTFQKFEEQLYNVPVPVFNVLKESGPVFEASPLTDDSQFEKLKVVYPKREIQINTLDTAVREGTRVLVTYSQIDETFLNLVHELDGMEETVRVVCAIGVFPEERVFLESFKNVEAFYTQLDVSVGEHLNLLKFVTERVKALVTEGKKVVFVVNGIDRIVEYQNLAEDRDIHDLTNLYTVRRLFALARDTEKGTLTVVGITRRNQKDKFSEALYEEFSRVANSTIVVN